jgi:hypothetical protein
MQAARSCRCKDSAACTIVTTSLLEVRYGSFSNRLNAPRGSVSAAKPQCARWALAGVRDQQLTSSGGVKKAQQTGNQLASQPTFRVSKWVEGC